MLLHEEISRLNNINMWQLNCVYHSGIATFEFVLPTYWTLVEEPNNASNQTNYCYSN